MAGTRTLNVICGRLFSNFPRPAFIQRHLYCAASLGINGYEKERAKAALQFSGIEDNFRERMFSYFEKEDKNLVFTEDLKAMVHLAKSDPRDITLVENMLTKFNSQNKGMRFGNYTFGTVVMRMYHFLGCPQEALQAMHSDGMEGVFDQISAYQVLMDLLFRNERYQDTIDIFQHFQERQLTVTKFPKTVVTLLLASCYKLNTPESFETAHKAVADSVEYGAKLTLRAIAFATALARNQGHPHIAMEILSACGTHHPFIVKNLWILTLLDLNRLDEIMPILRSVYQEDLPNHQRRNKKIILEETLSKVADAVEKVEDKEMKLEFSRIQQALREYEYISDLALDDALCMPIEKDRDDRKWKNVKQEQNKALLRASFRYPYKKHKDTNNRQVNPQRLGLMERE
ncbi:pentatricopeptide repeat-containing protein 2, mitochondrial-like isoform X2 [Oratosquilla oratoria]|uniref:pentatricopeptide repeat-containing protein 2, mitochondrial-like isoform X2 n=1 Tax=Oratosquilla oratoria TaxID=337810 RepID=UPI003F760CC2